MNRKWMLLYCLLSCSSCFGSDYFVTVYQGKYTDNGLADEILMLQDIQMEDANILAVALAKEIDRPNEDRSWEAEAQVAKHFNQQSHWEFNALAIHRWQNFNWDQHLTTTFAIGGGVSYATETPPLEIASHTNSGAAKTLFYLLLEATVQLPQFDNWSVVARIHHRSGIFRLINNVKGGSNQLALGVKWQF